MSGEKKKTILMQEEPLMADYFRKISDFWNTIMEEMQNVISAFDTEGGSIFSQIKDLIASLLGQVADSAEKLEVK